MLQRSSDLCLGGSSTGLSLLGGEPSPTHCLSSHVGRLTKARPSGVSDQGI